MYHQPANQIQIPLDQSIAKELIAAVIDYANAGQIGNATYQLLSANNFQNPDINGLVAAVATGLDMESSMTGAGISLDQIRQACSHGVQFKAAAHVRKYPQFYGALSPDERYWVDQWFIAGENHKAALTQFVESRNIPGHGVPPLGGYPHGSVPVAGARPSIYTNAGVGQRSGAVAAANSLPGMPAVDPASTQRRLFNGTLVSGAPAVERLPIVDIPDELYTSDADELFQTPEEPIGMDPDQPYPLAHSMNTAIELVMIEKNGKSYYSQAIKELNVNFDDHNVQPTFNRIGEAQDRPVETTEAYWRSLEVSTSVKADIVKENLKDLAADTTRDKVLAKFDTMVAVCGKTIWGNGAEHARLTAVNTLTDAGLPPDLKQPFEYYYYDMEVFAVPGRGDEIREKLGELTESCNTGNISSLAAALRNAQIPGDIINGINRRATKYMNGVINKSLGLDKWSMDSFMDDWDEMASMLRNKMGNLFDQRFASQFQSMARVIACVKTPEFSKAAYEEAFDNIDLGERVVKDNDLVVIASLHSVTRLPFDGVELDLQMEAKTVLIPKTGLPRLYGLAHSIFLRTAKVPRPAFTNRTIVTRDGYSLELDRALLAGGDHGYLITK